MSKWTQEQTSAIYESGTNIIVSAGAGSGKTAVLSQRVLEKIKSGIHINELLILTFTKAAASEMKDRIRKKIASDKELENELNLLNSSYITTFDSFALSVVKKYHYLLNIPKNISITDESIVKIKHKEIIDNIFEGLYESKILDFEKLIDKYCVKNDNSIREVISNICMVIDGFIDKYEYIDNIKNNFYTDESINKIIEEYYSFLEEKRSLIKLELNNLSCYFDYDYIDKINNSISSIMECDIKDLHLITNVDLPKVPRGSEEDAKNCKKGFNESIKSLLSFSEYGDYENIKNNILLTKSIVFTILDIVSIYIENMKEYKEENQIYTFNDISSLAIKIVKENESARCELKNSFKEIMIDEYQDTNDVQDIFISYIENNNVYMVGDIKQSIYRFRGSNPDIFKEKYEKYSNNNGGRKIDLIKNFRSRSEVLNNINRIFELIMDYNIGGAEYKQSHEMIYGNTLYDKEKDENINYNIDILEYDNDKDSGYSNMEVEIFSIAKDIKDKLNSKLKVFDKETGKLRDATYNDFVIICDRSKYFNDFKKIFEYLGIPLCILKDDKLNSSIDISIIKNIIDLIIRINNKDYGIDYKYDLLSIGRSFLYELDDSYLFDIFNSQNYENNIIYNDFSKINSINSKSIPEILEEILDITDFYNKIYKIGDYENINVRIKTIYNLASEFNNKGNNIIKFRDYLNNIIDEGIDIKYNAYMTSSESVKILTTHKSKGLEYPICYFADLDHEFNYKELTKSFVVSKKYGLIVANNLENDDKSILKLVYKNDYKKNEISEKIRLFYVALTRAREKIIIVIPKKDMISLEKNENGVIEEGRRLSFNKLSDFIYAVKYYLSDYFKDIDIDKINLSKNYLYKRDVNKLISNKLSNIIVNEIQVDKEIINDEHFSHENIGLISLQSKKNMEYGTKIHEVFEYIDMKNYDESIIEDDFIRSKVSKFMNNELLKNIKDADVYHEYEFEYEMDNTNYHGIIDLMLEYDDRINIIDFKLKNIMNSDYIKQLNGYKEYINRISGKKINLYLYSIMDEIFVNLN